MIVWLTLSALAAEPTSLEVEFAGAISALSAEEQGKMQGTSHHEGCPVPLSDLRGVDFSHYTPDGSIHMGRVIVHDDVAKQVLGVLKTLFSSHYPIERASPVHLFGGDDDASMAANNTSAFNCRKVGGTNRWSEHSFGRAIDINPMINPMVTSSGIYPPSGAPYADRTLTNPMIINNGGPVVSAFQAIGWGWGGHWKSLKDYQHFSQSGR